MQNKNNFSLEIATRMTLSLLPADSGAKDLVFFLGCLPGGITDDFLRELVDESSIDRDLPYLKDLNLIQQEDEQENNDQRNQQI